MVARSVVLSGALILLARAVVIGASFVAYSGEYGRQLQALDHVREGSRVVAITRHGCSEAEWRMSRLDMLATMATPERQAWVNVNWTVPGLHMARSRIDPAGEHRIPQFVWDAPCAHHAESSLGKALTEVPYEAVDYVWMLDTGLPPAGAIPGRLVWQWKRSALYRLSE
jgi:hypothetical protein